MRGCVGKDRLLQEWGVAEAREVAVGRRFGEEEGESNGKK
jgi:hypothetical protein